MCSVRCHRGCLCRQRRALAGLQEPGRGLAVFCSFDMALAWKLSKFFMALSWFPAPKVMALATTPAHWSVPEVATGRSTLSAFTEAARTARVASKRATLRIFAKFTVRCQRVGNYAAAPAGLSYYPA